MEASIVFNPQDYAQYLQRAGQSEGLLPAAGYAYSGSHARRNIEKIYERAEAAGVTLSLESAVKASLGPSSKVQHVLVSSGFYVLHNHGGTTQAGLAPGSCETDGPLGALALVRAFALRGKRVSLFCDAHNGPVLKAGYEAMMSYFAGVDTAVANQLRTYSRCLPFVSDTPVAKEDDAPDEQVEKTVARICDPVPGRSSAWVARAVRAALRLAAAVRQAWSPAVPVPVDCLFALERLGAPYRNIRGRDLSEHTEFVDWLWPVLRPDATSGGRFAPNSLKKLELFLGEHGLRESAMQELRSLAGVLPNAITLGIGDGGNEVGMGKVAHLRGVAELSPGADYVALSENGCYRTCDHLVLATVSNWGGSAFEMAANVLVVPSVDYMAGLRAAGRTQADVERHLLAAIMAPPFTSVDGIDPARELSVDGMDFEPHHKGLYDLLWRLAEDGMRKP